MKSMRKIVRKKRTIPFYFPKSTISQKDIKEIWQASYNEDVSASELIEKKYYRNNLIYCLSPLSKIIGEKNFKP